MAAGIAEVPPPLPGDWSARSGYELGRRLAGDPAVTAMFVANDQMALGAAAGAARGRPAIPDDVSVVGFDDIPEAAYFLPPLTTVRQDFGELGQPEPGVLVRHDRGERPACDPALVGPELIVRASTAIPAASRLGRPSRSRDHAPATRHAAWSRTARGVFRRCPNAS